jgi:predicted Abi (CAAX) family protease
MSWTIRAATTLLRRRLRHVQLACATVPSRREWGEAAAIFAGAGALGLAFGLRSRLVRPELMEEPLTSYLLLPGLLAVTPGLTEELVFRGLLLPHPREPVATGGRLLALAVSLAAFVLWHPFNGRAARPAGRHVFTDGRFLFQTVVLGGACAAAYMRAGSIWPPAVMHWLTVTAWILALGGRRHLRDGVAPGRAGDRVAANR